METTKTIIERASQTVGETTVNFEYEHQDGELPSQLKAAVTRQNKNKAGNITNVTVIQSSYNIETGAVQLNLVNGNLADKAVLSAILDGFSSIVESFNS
jgi:hypothetical protein